MKLDSRSGKMLTYSAVGFAIPAVVIGLIAIYRLTFHDIHPMDRQNDIARLPGIILIPSLGLALLFGLAALGSFTPTAGMSFIRSLLVISVPTTIAVFATRQSVPRRAIDPDAWMQTAIPVAVALITTIAVLLYNKWMASQPDKDTSEMGTTAPGCESVSVEDRG